MTACPQSLVPRAPETGPASFAGYCFGEGEGKGLGSVSINPTEGA